MDPLQEPGVRGLSYPTWEEQQAQREAEFRDRQVRNRAALRRQVAEAEIQRIEQQMLPSAAPLMEALAAERDQATAALAQLDAQDTGRLFGAERAAVARARAELVERVRQIDQGAAVMAEGDLRHRIAARGAMLDSRSLPALRRQVTTLLERRDELRRELEVMTG